jgi:mono/diheme cytochrome c family protein
MKQNIYLARLFAFIVTLQVALLAEPLRAADASEPSNKKVDYLQKIKPLLGLRCTTCHGPLKQNGELRLDAAVLIRKGGDSGPAIKPGKPNKSLLLDALLDRNGVSQMPAEGKPLNPKEIDLIRKWIEQGAVAPADEQIANDPRLHWAYRVPKRSPIPSPQQAGRVRNPIDAFLSVEYQKRGLVPQLPAEKYVLLRRVFLDLTGLPPKPEELHAFLADDSLNAYEKVVGKLLESPRYGERWGRHWMDVWRYSDWYGYRKELRNSARHIWRWRDWIVESLNEDKPYNQMIVQMLAADEADPTNRDNLRATGFLARNYYKFNRNVWLDDAIEHTSKAFLGLTFNCARCHDHMYDPIAQKEYYQFRAIFEPYRVRTDPLPGHPDVTKEGLALAYDADLDVKTFVFERGNDKYPLKDNPVDPAIPKILNPDGMNIQPIDLPPSVYYPGLRRYVQQDLLQQVEQRIRSKEIAVTTARQKLVTAKQQAAKKESTSKPQLAVKNTEEQLANSEKQLAAVQSQLLALKARIAADETKYLQPSTGNLKTLALEASRLERTAAVQTSEAKLAQVQFDLSQARRTVASGNKQQKKNVLDLEKKLAPTKKKLTEARKLAEQVDETYQPLTELYPKTTTGRRLALARWIASEKNPLTARVAVNHIWMRHFGKPLVETMFDFGLKGKPSTHPELLDWMADEFVKSGWSMKHLHRLIVTSNTYRMKTSGDVAKDENMRIDPDNVYLWKMNSRRMESEAVRDSVLWVSGELDFTMGGPELDSNLGQTTNRRSIYYRHAPEKFMTFLKLFDAPSTHECYRRNETIIPQQALALMNSPLSIEQSRRLAKTLNAQVGTADNPKIKQAFIDALFERVLCRLPIQDERTTCQQFLKTQAKRLADPKTLTTFLGQAIQKVKASTKPHLRARESLVHVLLNHNEFVTIR